MVRAQMESNRPPRKAHHDAKARPTARASSWLVSAFARSRSASMLAGWLVGVVLCVSRCCSALRWLVGGVGGGRGARLAPSPACGCG